ncbi:MAG: LuxR C-terminal-related transcriptional regulator [Alphaproteobacteria bacterium]|nr:LuxR C-terminal-related transcriptional regulator [Alphaproteobacteria bacterium]
MADEYLNAREPGFFVDSTLDVALDPTSLDAFIDAWNAAGLERGLALRSVEDIEELGPDYYDNLKRADLFLQRGETPQPELQSFLKYFDSLAAFVVDAARKIVEANTAAQEWLGPQAVNSVVEIGHSAEERDAFRRTLVEAIAADGNFKRVLKVHEQTQQSPILLQIRRLSEMENGDGAKVLVVSSQRYWRTGQDDALKATFGLTSAECEIVHALVQGKTIKGIAKTRGTSEGTVRDQVKTVFSKMDVKSQSEIIRLVLPMTDLPLLADETTGAAPAVRSVSTNWLEEEVWRPFRSLYTPDGRKLDYHEMGPADGAPILYSHMGYCQARWSRSMIELAYQHKLRVICPIRAGFGHSENLHPNADVMVSTRNDTLRILDSLGISKLPYIAHGNDLVFAVDLIVERPEVIPELIGICARPCLPGNVQLLGTGAWQRFFMSTAKYAPQIVHFGSKAAVAMGKRMGMKTMHQKLCKDSPADLALLDSDEMRPVVLNNSSMLASSTTNAAQAFAMEYIAIEQDWSALMLQTRDIPMQILFGEQDPTIDLASVERIRAAYPWIELKVMEGTGQFLMFQKYQELIPLFAKIAHRYTT